MKSIVIALFAVFWAVTGAAPAIADSAPAISGSTNVPDRNLAEPSSPAPTALYGPAIEFDVLRKGRKVGMHRTTFERDGENLIVTSRLDVKIKVLFFTAYQSRYESVETWRAGVLQRLEVFVDDNGETYEITARREGERLVGQGPNGALEAEAPLFPTNHWNSAVLEKSRVLNTLSGTVDKVDIEPIGLDEVVTGAGRRAAAQFRYTGGFEARVWYDLTGRWVKLAFKAKDGSDFEYVCRRCGAEDGA